MFSALSEKCLKVCLLDDDPWVLKSTERLLHSAGWETKTFIDPFVFLEFAQACCPKVAVIDMLMPLMHGLEVQKQLRDVSPSTRVIVLTSKDDPSVRSRAMQAGASDFFLKPIADDEFLAGVESAFGNHR